MTANHKSNTKAVSSNESRYFHVQTVQCTQLLARAYDRSTQGHIRRLSFFKALWATWPFWGCPTPVQCPTEWGCF